MIELATFTHDLPLAVAQPSEVYPMLRDVSISPDQTLHGTVLLMQDEYNKELDRLIPIATTDGSWSFTYDLEDTLTLDGDSLLTLTGDYVSPDDWAWEVQQVLYDLCHHTARIAWLAREDGPVLVGPSLCGSAGVTCIMRLTGSRRREVSYYPTAAIIDHPPARLSSATAKARLAEAESELASLMTWQFWETRSACLYLWLQKAAPKDMTGWIPVTEWTPKGCPNNNHLLPGATVPAAYVPMFAAALAVTTPQAWRDANGNVLLSHPAEKMVYLGRVSDVLTDNLRMVGKSRLRLWTPTEETDQ